MKRVLLALALLAALPAVTASGADFTATSPSPGNTFAAAADFNSVAVALTDPGSPLVGTVTLQATATSDRGIASVVFQRSDGGAWTDLCTDTGAPYTCAWNTASAADGAYDLRVRATDTAGHVRTATVAARTVNNAVLAAALANPGTAVSGTRTLTATATIPAAGLRSLAIQHRAPAGTWQELCTGTSSPRSCALNTTALPDGARELRAVAEDDAGNVAVSTPRTVTVDNTPPDPPVTTYPADARGTVTVSATAFDGGSGIAAVAWEVYYGGSWYEACRDPQAPFQCSVNSTQAADGVYSARTVAIDHAGVRTLGPAFSVRLDNTAPAAGTLTAPAGTLSGAVALDGTPSDAGGGVATWEAQYRRTGESAWSTACSDTTPAPWSCEWPTTGLPDGSYDLRARVTDRAGNTSATATVVRTVDG